MNNNYYNKYLKYKQKYALLKKNLDYLLDGGNKYIEQEYISLINLNLLPIEKEKLDDFDKLITSLGKSSVKIIEVGAGDGCLASKFCHQYLSKVKDVTIDYYVTDYSTEEHFLSLLTCDVKNITVHKITNVDATNLIITPEFSSLAEKIDFIISNNPYGYGIMQENDDKDSVLKIKVDTRFIDSSMKMLSEGGKLIINAYTSIHLDNAFVNYDTIKRNMIDQCKNAMEKLLLEYPEVQKYIEVLNLNFDDVEKNIIEYKKKYESTEINKYKNIIKQLKLFGISVIANDPRRLNKYVSFNVNEHLEKFRNLSYDMKIYQVNFNSKLFGCDNRPDTFARMGRPVKSWNTSIVFEKKIDGGNINIYYLPEINLPDIK